MRLGIALLALAAPLAHGAEPAIDFARDIEPLLARACVTCHSGPQAQAGLALTSRTGALQGGASGPALAPGKGDESLLVRRVAGALGLPRMPMGQPPLSEAETGTLRRWIDEGAPWPEASTEFSEHIRPIFEARCTRCHGAELQRNQLRLDSRAGALRGGLSGKVIVPGKSGESALYQRITGVLRPSMPFEGPPLSAAEVERIKAWIDAGAPGAGDIAEARAKKHWAYVKPERPELPAVKDAAWVRNPIDAFVLARLEHEGLGPSPDAAKETLIRRVSLDLVGLPPTLAEVDAFLADRSPGAYEKVVDRLLASSHYGERWARPWLDLARYADTNGYEKDRRRTAYRYRDWVIDALNADMPFREFTIEQIAGDMLPDATVAQKIATGFHRNTLLNQEGGIDVEEARWETLVDRVNTTASVFLGSTMNCAQCHNHKYDPFSQKDYYRMLAFFDNADYHVEGVGEVVRDKWIVEPELELATAEQAQKRDALRAEAEALQGRIDKADLQAELAAWEREVTAPAPAWTPLAPSSFRSAAGATLQKGDDGSVLAAGASPDKDTYMLTATASLPQITAFRLEALPDSSLPSSGPGRAPSGNFRLTRFGVAAASVPVRLERAAADYVEDSTAAALAIDTSDETGWAAGAEPGHAHAATFVPVRPVVSTGTTPAVDLVFTLEHNAASPQQTLGRFRLSVTDSPNPWGGLGLPPEVRAILDVAQAGRTPEQAEALLAYFRARAPSLDAARDRLAQVKRALGDLVIPTAMVMGERAGFERPSTPLRIRGSFMSPGERVYAAPPAFLPPLASDQPANRLGLARWLVDEENPLTARVTVNRFWEQLFGRGLVLTSEDFGSQGDPPSHPELLDWLATEFVRQGGSMKKIQRSMVTSATYRQASAVTPALLERDPANRLLARGPRFRVEAETVRDVALEVAALLSAKVGGPSVFPDQPDGVWDTPYNNDKWVTSPGEDRYRRSLYTFARRTAPYPMLTTFDAPSREFCTVRRVRTNTPLQALTTLNDPAFFDAARALADRVMREVASDPSARAARGFRLCTARRPTAAELRPILRFYREQRARFVADTDAANAVAAVAASPIPSHCPVPATGSAKVDVADKAAWTMVANVLLNLDETLTKE